MVYEKDGKVIVTQLRPMSDMPSGESKIAWYTRPHDGHSYWIDVFKYEYSNGTFEYHSEQELDYIPIEQLSGWIDLHYDNSSLHNL